MKTSSQKTSLFVLRIALLLSMLYYGKAQSLALRQNMTPIITFATCDIGSTSIVLHILVPIPSTLTSPNELGELFFAGSIDSRTTQLNTNSNITVLSTPTSIRYFQRGCVPFFTSSNTSALGIPLDSTAKLTVLFTGFQPSTSYRMVLQNLASIVGQGSIDIQTFFSLGKSIEFTTKSSSTPTITLANIKSMNFEVSPRNYEQFVLSLPVIYQNLYPNGSQEIDCRGESRYYSSPIGSSWSFTQIDSLLSVFTTMQMPLDTAWIQDNTSCDGKNAASSEVLIKLRRDDPRIRSFGFVQRFNDWANACQCRNYRIYFNFLRPVSVSENSSQSGFRIVPNPSTEAATISLSLPASSPVRLTLHDALGREVRGIAESMYAAGTQEFSVPLDGLPSGIYFVRANIGGQVVMRRLAVVR